MANLKGGAVIAALLVLSAGAHGQVMQAFSISCGTGGHVSQHYEYDGKKFVFYTNSAGGKNVIQEMINPSAVITREEANGYQFQRIRVRGGRKGLNIQETTSSMKTFLLNGRIDILGGEANPAWDNAIVETRLTVQFDPEGYVTQAFKETHRREKCKLKELR